MWDVRPIARYYASFLVILHRDGTLESLQDFTFDFRIGWESKPYYIFITAGALD